MLAHPESLGGVDAVLRRPQLHEELLHTRIGLLRGDRLLLRRADQAFRRLFRIDQLVVVRVEGRLLAFHVRLSLKEHVMPFVSGQGTNPADST